MCFLCFGGDRAWVWVGVHARKPSFCTQNVGFPKDTSTVAAFTNPSPGFLHLTQGPQRVKEEEALPQVLGRRVYNLDTQTPNRTRQESDRPV